MTWVSQNQHGTNGGPGTNGRGLGSGNNVHVTPASEIERGIVAQALSTAYPWNMIDGMDEGKAEQMLESGSLYMVKTKVAGMPDAFPVGAFCSGECMGRPAVLYPLLLNGDEEEFITVIRRGALQVAQDYEDLHGGERDYVPPHIYMQLMADQRYLLDRLYNEVGEVSMKRFATVNDYIKSGHDMHLLRWERSAPRTDISMPSYGQESLSVDLDWGGVNNVRSIDLEDMTDRNILRQSSVQMATTDPWKYYGYNVAECERKLQTPGSQLLVAFTGEGTQQVPVGFALYHPQGFLGMPEIVYICVFHHYRGKGIGTRLIQEAEGLALEDRSEFDGSARPRIFLTVSEPNKDAIKLYQKLGFVEIGRELGHNIGSEFEIFMVKGL